MNDRELVTLVYVAMLVVVVLAYKGTRPQFLQLLKQLLLSRLTIALVVYFGVIVWAILLMQKSGFWTPSLLGNTLLWIVFVGFAWFINVTDASKNPHFFRRKLLETLGLGALIEFVVNLEALPLPLEFVVQGLLSFVILLNTVASGEPQYRPVARLTSGLLAIAGLGLFVYTIVKIMHDWSTLNWRDVLNQLFLPVWLTLAAVPGLYLIGLVAAYESLALHMSFWNDRKPPTLRAMAGVAAELRGSLTEIAQFRGPAVEAASQTRSFRRARQAVQDFKQKQADDEAARATARRRLIENTGKQGTDSTGLQLDRREFAATKSALRWLATCHMGWYRRDDYTNAYRRDLLDVLGSFSQQGLPDPHGIEMRVRKDGQAWYAYRTTPSGHVFAMGASERPPSQWFWDGPRPPSGYPSKKSDWTSFMEPDRPEWREEQPT